MSEDVLDQYNKDLRLAVGQTLKDLREKSGVKKTRFSEDIAMNTTRLDEFENGVRDFKFSTLVRYADALGYSVEISFVPAEDLLMESIFEESGV